MRPLRIIHLIFGVLALVPLLLIGAALVLPAFQNAESSRIEGLQACVRSKLEAYRYAKGNYPDTLQALSFTNSPREIRAQPDLGKMTYNHSNSGYELAYTGRWYHYHYSLSVSNNGVSTETKFTAK